MKMRDMGLISIRDQAKELYDKEHRKYQNHINQHFDASGYYESMKPVYAQTYSEIMNFCNVLCNSYLP